MIGLVDTTVRDGHQSLWSANALTTAMIAEIAPVMDRVGFHAIDFTSSTHMAMAVRWHARGPVGAHPRRPRADARHAARLHHARDAVHRRGSARRLDVMRARAALRDPQRDPARLGRRVDERRRDRPATSPRIAKAEGAEEVLVGLVYTISPVHTDEYYAERARADRREPARRRAQPQGSRRAADARARAHARAGAARGRARACRSRCTRT